MKSLKRLILILILTLSSFSCLSLFWISVTQSNRALSAAIISNLDSLGQTSAQILSANIRNGNMTESSPLLSIICGSIKVNKTGYVFLMNSKTGKIFACGNKDLIGKNFYDESPDQDQLQRKNNIIKKIKSGETVVGFYGEIAKKEIDGPQGKPNDFGIYSTPIEGREWAVCLVSPYIEYYALLKKLQNFVFFLTIFSLVAGILIALYVGKALNPLKLVGDSINEIASGNADLTQRLEVKKTKSEISVVVHGFNAFVEKLQTIVSSLKKSETNLVSADESLQEGTQNTATAITEIISNIESVNSQIIYQSDSVDETAGAVNQIASNIESLEKMIINQSAGIEQASAAIEEMVSNINSVNSSVEKMASSFMELEENASIGIKTQSDVNVKVKQIEDESKILMTANSAIAKIASQTNLLAMNAAIEAAHAGDAGKGFSVVADEIRKLSTTSTEQSRRIGEELERILNSINSVVDASKASSSAFGSVSNSIQNTDQLVKQIRSAMLEQQEGSKQITEALHAMTDSTSEVKNASSEMAEGNKHILSQIQNLQNVTSVIKESVAEMAIGAQKINETGSELTEVSNQVTDSIDSIKREIELFKV